MARSAPVALLALLVSFAPTAAAQPVTWEPLPLIPGRTLLRATAVGFLRGEGAQADDPAADTLVWFGSYGPLLYNPSGAAGAAGDNGEWGAWHLLARVAADYGVVTAAGSIVVNGQRYSRGTGRGRTWAYGVEDWSGPLFESSLPALVGPDGTPALFTTTSDDGNTARSFEDGAPGTWVLTGTGGGFPEAFGEVPPSPALPNGRVLIGVWNGVSYSDDGGLTYTRSSAYGSARYIAWSFTFRPVAGHPYGGTAYAGVQNLRPPDGGEIRGAEALRSEDGGATWTRAHAFTAAEMGLPVPPPTDVTVVVVYATPDGALWAGVSQSGGAAAGPRRGGVMRSDDGGATWTRADMGFRDATDRGYAVNQLKLSRTGVLYAATEVGVWRTTGPVVSGEASPPESSEVGVSVRPNPAGGHVEVAVTLAEGGPVRVVVLDALGREVMLLLDGVRAAGAHEVPVDTSRLPAGVYVVRLVTGGATTSTRLVVAR